MKIRSTRARQGTTVALGAVAASAALVLSGVTAAHAADVQLGPDDIAGFENGDEESAEYNYDQWHVGSTEDPAAVAEDSLEFGECSVTFGPVPAGGVASVTQVLKGFPVDARPTGVEEIAALFETLEVEMESGSVTLQVPLFAYDDEADETPDFTTVRNATAFTEAGTYTLAGEQIVGSGGGFGAEVTTEEFLEVLAAAEEDGAIIEALGFGITGDDGSVVSSVGALGDTGYFGTGDCLPGTPGGGSGDGGGDDDGDQAGDGVDLPQPTRPVAVDTGR